MRIVVLQGSPNTNGSTAILVEEFARGARHAGHDVVRIDVADAGVAPCTGCVACGYEGPCVQHDGMDTVRTALLDADMVVFATPLYYYGMTAQLKTVIDRLCSANASITRKQLRAVLIVVAWNSDDWTFDALEAHCDTLCRYLGMQDCGRILGAGCGAPAMTRRTKYPQAAFDLGVSL